MSKVDLPDVYHLDCIKNHLKIAFKCTFLLLHYNTPVHLIVSL